ncbi:MAG: FHA domain-containing protein [Acidobacteriota bacterium]
MIVNCPKCGAKYQYDESRFGEQGAKRLKCSKCESVFEVRRPASLPLADSQVRRTVVGSVAEPLRSDSSESGVRALDLESLPELAPLPGNRRFSLAVILGSSSGQIFPVNKPRVILGRAAGTDIQLQDSEVSRRHAMLEIRDDVATLIDLHSTNGVFVDGTRVARAVLESHGEFTLGNTTMMFIVTEMQDVP